MIDNNSPVSEEELHAYVDGELPIERREAIEAWLASHPDDSTRVATWRAQAETIRARYGSIVSEPVPARLALDRIIRRRKSWAALAAAATIAAFLIGGTAGWLARDISAASAAAPTEMEVFANEAMSAHRLYIGEVRHPIEVKAEEKHLLPWLSRRVGTVLRAPDLHAFDLKLLGGRLLPGVNSPAALFMYESGSGERVTIYVAKTSEPRTSFRYKVSETYGALRWSEAGYGWVVSGPDDKPRLKGIAMALYEQLDIRTPVPVPSRNSDSQLISRRGS